MSFFSSLWGVIKKGVDDFVPKEIRDGIRDGISDAAKAAKHVVEPPVNRQLTNPSEIEDIEVTRKVAAFSASLPVVDLPVTDYTTFLNVLSNKILNVDTGSANDMKDLFYDIKAFYEDQIVQQEKDLRMGVSKNIKNLCNYVIMLM